MILRENALESWASAIKYSEELMLGKATFSNRKNFVASLQNAIELFVKQYMLNINDYRVADVKNIKADGTPLKQYLMSDDLNNFFLKTMNTTDMKNFYTLEFSKIKNIQKDLFKEFYDNNPGKEISAYLTMLQRLRNNERQRAIRDYNIGMLTAERRGIKSGRKIGRKEGRAEGETLGVSRINQLILELSKHGRTDDIVKAAADEEYQKKLLEEFDL